MPASNIAASVWTQEDEADEQEQDATTEQELLHRIDTADIRELRANFNTIMNDVVTAYGDNR